MCSIRELSVGDFKLALLMDFCLITHLVCFLRDRLEGRGPPQDTPCQRTRVWCHHWSRWKEKHATRQVCMYWLEEIHRKFLPRLNQAKHKQPCLCFLSWLGCQSERLWSHLCTAVVGCMTSLRSSRMNEHLCTFVYACVCLCLAATSKENFWQLSLQRIIGIVELAVCFLYECWGLMPHWQQEPLWSRVPWSLPILLRAASMKGSSKLPLG